MEYNHISNAYYLACVSKYSDLQMYLLSGYRVRAPQGGWLYCPPGMVRAPEYIDSTWTRMFVLYTQIPYTYLYMRHIA